MKKGAIGSYTRHVALLLGLFAAGQCAWANQRNEVVVLGDSLSDTGNLYALTGSFPPSPPYAERFSNGPVWVEYLAKQLHVPLDSRAYGGALTGPVAVLGSTFSNFDNIQYPGVFPPLPGIQEEVDALLADHPRGLNPAALYVVWAGGNEVFLGLQLGPAELAQLLQDAVQNLAGTVCRLGLAGARHFAVGNLPDLGLTPLGWSLGPQGAGMLSVVSAQFNAGLAQAVGALPDACADTVVMLDAFQYTHDITARPKAFGFANVAEPCVVKTAGGFDFNEDCMADPESFLFWDEVHPTTAGHAVFADLFRNAFCGSGGLRSEVKGRPATKPPPEWRNACYGLRRGGDDERNEGPEEGHHEGPKARR
ncbi:MAG: SGNH/GDSL hydrolase family protein [Deltaproteobacteria bacterium]|nr:SGNH/GDSL hydrolase family protein [Deltaproteobacteria bacterium]